MWQKWRVDIQRVLQTYSSSSSSLMSEVLLLGLIGM